MFKEGQIIITSNRSKKNILKKGNKTLLNIKIYTSKEFNRLYYFDYDEETIYYVMKKYNVKYEIAKIYIENLYYIEKKEYQSTKLKFLSSLKEELFTEKRIKRNPLFLNYLKNKEIVIYNIPLSKEMEHLKQELEKENTVIIAKEERPKYQHTIYEVETREEEIVYVANKICQLIKKGVPIQKICITNISEEYRKDIKRIFPMFHIPFTLEKQETIYATFLASKFFELYSSDLSITLSSLHTYIDSKEAEEIYNQMINIVNKYTFVEDKNQVYEMIKYDFKNTKIGQTDKVESVHEVSLKDTTFQEEDYVFILSFNQGIIPIIYKDENYLTDKENRELSISLTVDKNNLEKKTIEECLSSIKNATITYKKYAEGENFTIASINEELNYEVLKIEEIELENSNTYNKIKLAALLDEYYKYGTKNPLLSNLNHHYTNIPYNTYKHAFTGINKQDLKEYLDNKLTLSYSSLDKYYRCPFSYYVGNILKLNIFEEQFYQLVGNLFHSILEKNTKTKLSYDELWEQEVNALNRLFTPKEQFFLKKLKKELEFIIEVIKDQENFTNLHDELHEERVYVSLSGEMKITFTGIIDKIKYKKEKGETIIAIIDYKTGNPNLDLTTIPYGIGMQLPVYLYLAKNSTKLENIKVAGFYLQKVLNNEIAVDNTHSYEQLKKKNLLLQGFSNADLSILSTFDNSFMDSNIIKSMKVKKDNSFYHYCKVLTNKEMEKISAIAEEKIKKGAKSISNADFSIAPKKIGKINYGCNLCKMRDICFHTNDDIVEKKQLNIEEILGGENDGLDEGTGTSD